MHIAVMTPQFPPRWGGVGNGAFFETRAFAEQGHTIDIITRKRDRGMEFPDLHPNITVHEVPMLLIPMLFAVSFGRNATRKILDLGNDFDAIHIHSNMTLVPRETYNRLNGAIVSTMHGTWVGERSHMCLRDITPSIESLNDLAVMYISPIVDPYEDYALMYSDGVTIDSVSEMKAIHDRHLPSLCPRTELIPEGVDTETFNPGNEDRSILDKYGVGDSDYVLFSISRLAARKGYFKLLRLFSSIREERDDVKLVIGGNGPQERSLHQWVVKQGLDRDIIFTGPLPFPDLKALYATADLFVFYSLWEGQGLVIMESMASGTPVVSTDVGGVPEMVDHGKDGYYFHEGEDAQAINYINDLLDDPVKRQKFGERGHKKMTEVWDWRFRVTQIENMMENIIEEKGGRKHE